MASAAVPPTIPLVDLNSVSAVGTAAARLPIAVRGLSCSAVRVEPGALLALPPLAPLDSRVLLVITGSGSVRESGAGAGAGGAGAGAGAGGAGAGAGASSSWAADFDAAGGVVTIALAAGARAGAELSASPAGAGLRALELVVAGAPSDAAGLASSAAAGAVPLCLPYAAAPRYTEAIKSPTTVSRTLLGRGVVPRLAAGTVSAAGPDAVAPHAHAMLEQLFLGLPGCDSTVSADGATAPLREWGLLHIPLGSTHGVTVGPGAEMNYLWIDLFHTAAGEEWLENHKEIKPAAEKD